MKCPKCEELGISSTVKEDSGKWKTLFHYPSFTDENGKDHIHDNNMVTTKYECSRHHIFSVEIEGKECWCGWNKVPKITVTILN